MENTKRIIKSILILNFSPHLYRNMSAYDSNGRLKDSCIWITSLSCSQRQLILLHKIFPLHARLILLSFISSVSSLSLFILHYKSSFLTYCSYWCFRKENARGLGKVLMFFMTELRVLFSSLCNFKYWTLSLNILRRYYSKRVHKWTLLPSDMAC